MLFESRKHVMNVVNKHEIALNRDDDKKRVGRLMVQQN